MTRWLFRCALWLVPASWRRAVQTDLDQEARVEGRSGAWRAWQALAVALRLRWTFGGDTTMSDTRYALRSLLHARWFALGAVMTFALGIGVNVAVFSAVDRMLFRPLPYDHPEQLFVLREYSGERAGGTVPTPFLAELLKDGTYIAEASSANFTDSFAESPDPADESSISLTEASYTTLAVFGVHPVIGRDFTREDAVAKRRVALISFELWQRRFGGAADITGRELWGGGQPVEIVGVLPRDFIPASNRMNPNSQGLFLDSAFLRSPDPADRTSAPYVRLRPGVKPEAAEAVIQPLYARAILTLAGGNRPRTGPSPTVHLTSLDAVLFGRYSTMLWLVVTAAGLVLLVACANMVSLLLVRARSREHVAAMQVALGAGAWRLWRGALIEVGILSLTGTVVGAVVFAWSASALRAVLPGVFSRYSASIGEPRVLACAALLMMVCVCLSGLLPAWRLSHQDVIAVLRRSGASGRGRRLNSGRSLLAIEAAIGVVLVAGAVVTARSLVGLKRVDLGFDPDHAYWASVVLPEEKDPDVRYARYMQVLDVIRNMPGVRLAGAENDIFLSGSTGWRGFGFGEGNKERGARNNVTHGFFEALGMRPVTGRTITADDVARHVPVAVVSRAGIGALWPGVSPADALGRRLPFKDLPDTVVVGVVPDVRSVYAQPPTPTVYLPIEAKEMRFLDYVLRVDGDAVPSRRGIFERVRQQVGAPLSVDIAPISKSLDASLVYQEFQTTLFGTFALAALLLAGTGLYSVGSFEVARRRHEMSVRCALGATAADLRRLVARETLLPVAAGIGAGLYGAYWAARFIQSFLSGLDARDPWTFVMTALALLVTAIVAVWVPTRRAARTNPAAVLRAE